ncbi:hypothetical protein Bca4012_043910 [Brassica carinata]|uniref:Uncharacterized protein n=1 Tax=Brassica carinata TaxID=52824 RepID=A0A8X7QSW0_BRACI|nr:hypothetical protein Bca52824_058503 [Brassica carinata]
MRSDLWNVNAAANSCDLHVKERDDQREIKASKEAPPSEETKRQQESLNKTAVTKPPGTPWDHLDTQGVSDSLPCDDAETAECRIDVKSIWILESPFSSPPGCACLSAFDLSSNNFQGHFLRWTTNATELCLYQNNFSG